MFSFLIHLHLKHSHAREGLFEVLRISFLSPLNTEAMLWQQETESKGWKDQVEFETQNFQCLNRFQIWKLVFSQPQVFMILRNKENSQWCYSIFPIMRFQPSLHGQACVWKSSWSPSFSSETGNLLWQDSATTWVCTHSLRTCVWWEKIKSDKMNSSLPRKWKKGDLDILVMYFFRFSHKYLVSQEKRSSWGKVCPTYWL